MLRGSRRQVSSEATATTPAPTMAATLMPSTKACLAASASGDACWAELAGDRQGAGEAGLGDGLGRVGQAGDGVGDRTGVGGGHERAEDGDAEGAAELPGGVVHGRADAGLAAAAPPT